jgi:hypothetical protein
VRQQNNYQQSTARSLSIFCSHDFCTVFSLLSVAIECRCTWRGGTCTGIDGVLQTRPSCINENNPLVQNDHIQKSSGLEYITQAFLKTGNNLTIIVFGDTKYCTALYFTNYLHLDWVRKNQTRWQSQYKIYI